MKKLIAKIFGRCPPKEKTPNWKAVSSVLIRPIGTGIGDAVVLSAVIGQIKKAYPACRVGVFTTQRNQFIFEHTPGVDECLKDTPLNYLKQHNKWQIFLDYRPTFTTRNIICDFFLAPEYIICFEKTAKKSYSVKTIKNYHFYIPKLAATHLSKSLSLTPFASHIDSENPEYKLDLPSDKQIKLVNKWLQPDRPNILVCPFGSDRMLDKSLLDEVITQLDKYYKIHFISAYEKKDYPLLAKNITYTGKISLETFMALYYKVDFIITIDTATVHIACAYNKPFVSIYSGYEDNFNLFCPLKQKGAYAVQSSQKVTKHIHKIDKWSAQDVINWTKSFLEKWNSK